MMNFDSIMSFTSSLRGIHNSKEYLKESEGKFTRIQAKSDKNLNTSQIVSISLRAMNSIHSLQLDYAKKANLYQELTLGINDYVSRLYQHKNIFQKIASWFGIVGGEEWGLKRWSEASRSHANSMRAIDTSIR